MIERIQERVTGLGDELILVTNKPDEYAHLGLPMVGDVYPDHGSLGGIYTAVYHATHPHTLIVACDMPWLNRPLLEYMLTLRQTADYHHPPLAKISRTPPRHLQQSLFDSHRSQSKSKAAQNYRLL